MKQEGNIRGIQNESEVWNVLFQQFYKCIASWQAHGGHRAFFLTSPQAARVQYLKSHSRTDTYSRS